MKKVGFLFGGKSFEHEVSITSLRSVLTSWSNPDYSIMIFGLDKNNTLQKFSKEEFLESFSPYSNFATASCPTPYETLKEVDVVFSLIHGSYGEDGAIQGLLHLMGIPFVGPKILSSAICMDKDVAKRLVKLGGIAVVDWVLLRQNDFIDFELIEQKIGFPCFVKPSTSGSSCGVSQVFSCDQLQIAVDEARKFSEKVLIEKAVQGMELECAVLCDHSTIASKVGRVIPKNAFYDYEAKYILEDGAKIEAPAKIDPSLELQIQQASLKIFKLLECSMMSRIDFFYDGTLYFNEINTIPGFTPISLYPKLLGLTGVEYQDLIDRLIDAAMCLKNSDKLLESSVK